MRYDITAASAAYLNKTLEPTAYSARSCLAPAFGGGSPPAFGGQSYEDNVIQIGAEALVALVALVVSIVALVRGDRTQRALQKSQSEHEALQSNVSLLVDVWSHIGSKPSLLRFHGITEEELKTAGIDVEELAYLIASFEAAGYYYEHIDKGTGPFPQDSLRYRMCASEATRKAWPLLKSFFVGSPTYVSRIEETIKLLERGQRQSH